MALRKLQQAAMLLAASVVTFGAYQSPAADKGVGGDRKAVAGLTDIEFKQLHQELMHGPGTLWLSIPWKTSIREGRELAVKEKKPILYWAVQGHVLSLC
jgi:hypothetical protein